jgi:uncharacterized protein (TIGR03437 family)
MIGTLETSRGVRRRRPLRLALAVAVVLSFITDSLARRDNTGQASRREAGQKLSALSGEAARRLRPDSRLALAARARGDATPARPGAYVPRRPKNSPALKQSLPATARPAGRERVRRRRAPVARRKGERGAARALSSPLSAPRLSAGTALSRVLHVSQLSLVDSGGTVEQFVDLDRDLVADERTTFDAAGGAYDVAVGRSGARYEVFTAVDDRGTGRTDDDVRTGVLVVALDTNGDFVADSRQTFDLGRDFGLPSAVSVVAGTTRDGREFVVVSSSGYYNSEDPADPANEESPGVVLLVRDQFNSGFDLTRSRELVAAGDDRLFNANALALLPSGDLVIADFQSNELRVARDTDGDGAPDLLAVMPYYDFPFSDDAADAPLDIAANSRGVLFSHSAGGDARLLAIYDTDGDGDGDDEFDPFVVSIDNNLVLHGLTVARDGTVYLIQDATGGSDLPADGGNGGVPHVVAFPDPALNGDLREGSIFVLADDEFTQGYSGLSFGVETALGPVGRLALVNSASLRGDATTGGLATVTGAGLTRGRRGATEAEARARGVRVTVEGASVPVLSFDDARVHLHLPAVFGSGLGSVVVSVDGEVTAADDARLVAANPGLFTLSTDGAGEAVALLVSGNAYTRAPFPARTGGQPAVVALFGTGWRNSLPVTVTVGGRAATVHYAGASGGFPGLDQINVAVPDGVTGAAEVVVTTADGRASRPGVFITVQ